MILNNEYTVGNAKEFSENDLNRFKEIVINAGEVSKRTFDNLISKNPLIIFIQDNIDIHAIGALKIPNDTYKQDVFYKSETAEKIEDFPFELGWIVSLKESKGYGKKIVEILSVLSPNIYATVRSENYIMKHILEKFSFKKTGNNYKSDRGNYDIELFIKKKDE